MKKLDQYKKLQEEIFEYFGYIEDWRVLPIYDSRECFWRLEGKGPGKVCFSDSPEELEDETGNYFENEIYTQRHLDKWVYRGNGYTMVVVDTHTDGNQFLQIFDNAKERP